MKKLLIILLTQILMSLAENLISFGEFRKAVTDNVYPTPTREQYDTIVGMALTAGNITTKQELAMFLAQVLWESAGLTAKKEIKCAANQCPSSYRTGKEQPGKYYYGRGYIQLTWLYNYEQCSKELYGDNRLVDDPDLVSDTEEGAWGSAFWYWAKHCHNADGVSRGQFGASTMAINGALECKGPYKTKAFKRFTIYVKVLKAFQLDDIKPVQDGCYPMTGAEASDFRLCDATGAHKNSVGMYHWCNDNCNAEDPNCPEDMCQCEGGNPQKKVKQNQTQSEPQLEAKPIKVESLGPIVSNRIAARIQSRIKEAALRTTTAPRSDASDLLRNHRLEPQPQPQPDYQPEADPQPDAQTYPQLNSELHPRPDPQPVPQPDLEPHPQPDPQTVANKQESSAEIGRNRFVFQYNEPMRLSTPRTPLNRTQILRNELGRLIRKRPVIRNGPQNQQ